MVREARFSWEPDRPLPYELSRREWDLDDPDLDDDAPRRRKKSQRDRQSTPQKDDEPDAC